MGQSWNNEPNYLKGNILESMNEAYINCFKSFE